MSGYTGRMNERLTVEGILSWPSRVPVMVVPDPFPVLRGILGVPKREALGVDSPRDLPKWKLEFAKRTVGVDTVVPPQGSLIRSRTGMLFEVLSEARDLRANRQTYGYELSLLPFDVLYPNLGTLGGVGGGSGTEVQFSMWSNTQAPRDGRGEYDDLEGEAPAHSWDVLRVTNASLTVGDDVYRVTSALLNQERPYVALRLRRRDS